MKITAQEARDLMPRGYIPTEAICNKIKSIAEAGLTYFWTDLTQGQIQEFNELGFKVEPHTNYTRSFKITWEK